MWFKVMAEDREVDTTPFSWALQKPVFLSTLPKAAFEHAFPRPFSHNLLALLGLERWKTRKGGRQPMTSKDMEACGPATEQYEHSV